MDVKLLKRGTAKQNQSLKARRFQIPAARTSSRDRVCLRGSVLGIDITNLHLNTFRKSKITFSSVDGALNYFIRDSMRLDCR